MNDIWKNLLEYINLEHAWHAISLLHLMWKIQSIFFFLEKKKSSGKYKVSVIQNMQCIMFYFIAQNLCKLGIILDGTYLLLKLPNIHYAQLFIRLKRIE